jgi:predicted MFS family arabinose efflux permease
LDSAITVCWSTWLSKGISDEPEGGGGLMVGGIQLSIIMGGALGGFLLDHSFACSTFIGGAILLGIASCVAGNGGRLKPRD